jgi:hypothetical protein
MNEEEIKARIKEILDRQQQFESQVRNLQNLLFEEILTSYVILVKSPEKFDALFYQFHNTYHLPVIQSLINDIQFILDSNIEHFSKEATDGRIIADVEKTLMLEFGFNLDGSMKQNGYFSDIAKDTTVKRDVRAVLLKELRNDFLNENQKENIKNAIKGNESGYGIYEGFYNKPDKTGYSIFDVYQKADRIAQNNFATDLNMQASIYVGGLIDGSRPFCKERNGKIYLRPEIEAWKDLSFQGKTKNYNPFEDLGGYRCRHHLSWIGKSTAMRLDKTIKIDSTGNLYRV